jgi:hypothetical protein
MHNLKLEILGCDTASGRAQAAGGEDTSRGLGLEAKHGRHGLLAAANRKTSTGTELETRSFLWA